VGQSADLSEFSSLGRERGRLKRHAETLMTTANGLFAGGDVATGPSTVIEAIAEGRRVAAEIDRFLGGEGQIDIIPKVGDVALDVLPEGERPPLAVPERAGGERVLSFEEVELGYSPEQARQEAQRCLRCDLEERA
jgi:NADPH-dependent glutamate synthase beta subunit-like oxidoreductase